MLAIKKTKLRTYSWEGTGVKRGWIVASLAFFALFCATIWQSVSLPLMDELGPGPGFFPLWLAVIGGILCLVLVFQTARAPADLPEAALTPDQPAIFRILSVIVVLAMAAAALDWLGWRITALLTAALLLPALGARAPLIITLFALAASFGVFHVFYYWLKVPLPIGVFGI